METTAPVIWSRSQYNSVGRPFQFYAGQYRIAFNRPFSALGAVFVSRLLLKRIPSILAGLLAGALVYGILYLFDDNAHHVAVIGRL